MNEIVLAVMTVMVAFMVMVGLAKFNAGIDDSWREQIVQHGCAEFYLDEKHDRQWRWKDCLSPKE